MSTIPPGAQLRAEFTSFQQGEQDGVTRQTPETVKVYYKSSPKGFSLAQNELTVDDGYAHLVLGELKVRTGISKNVKTGSEYDSVECYRSEHRPGQEHVLAALKKEAAARGANAVVYAYSELAQTSSRSECDRQAEANEFGGGWAVLVDTEHGAHLEQPQNEGT
ncbi:MAG: hypothetical protein GY811_06945 [Myxococcales bacterium]|nr:hypothetical protein [Myxococcales bacterium]